MKINIEERGFECPKCHSKFIWKCGQFPREGKLRPRMRCKECGYVSWPGTFKTDEEIIGGEEEVVK